MATRWSATLAAVSILLRCLRRPRIISTTLCGFSTGEIIRFRSAKIHGDYVTLYGGSGEYDSQCLADCDQPLSLPFIFDRGLDVGLNEIVWCADAPQGS